MERRHFEIIAKGLKASKPPACNIAAYAQWQYTVRHVVGEISLRNAHFDADRFFKACDYE